MQKILLLVDDDAQLLKVLSRFFKQEDYKILTAMNGAEALKILEKMPVHVVISDYRMPNMTGSELLAEVRKLHPEIIRIILSGYADFDAIKDSLNNGAIYKFITKPWDNDDLRKIVKEAFNLYVKTNPEKYSTSNGLLISDVDLQIALDKNQFEIYYQPIVTADKEQIVSAEALLRWRHPEVGLMQPEDFISLAEKTKLIIPMGSWLLHTACKQLKQWHDAGYPLKLAVNISPCQFNHPGLLDLIKEVLLEAQIKSGFLELEMTESLIMEDLEHNIAQLVALNKLGVTLSLDDFGTGHSSLSYLSKFPINTLKIDKSFIQEITTKKNIPAIVKMTIELAKILKLTTIAEGVETREQCEMLKTAKCDLIQGFYFSKPLPALAFTQFLLKKSN